MIEFRMPSLGADMEAATLIEWARRPGERVARGDVIAVVETQKGAIEIESFHSGVIDRILVQPGERVPVGQVLALIRAEDEAVPPTPTIATAAPGTASTATISQAALASIPAPTPPTEQSVPKPPATESVRARITPAARRLAESSGIDPASLMPGPDGTIGLEEVERARCAKSARDPSTRKQRWHRLRRDAQGDRRRHDALES